MWNSTVPTTGTYVSEVPIIFPANWTAINDILGREHCNFSSLHAGRHRPGRTGIVFSGPTSAVSGMPTVASGALAYDTTVGQLAVLHGTWRYVSTWPSTKVHAYIPANIGNISIMPTGGIIQFRAERFDMLSEYDTETCTFSPSADGFFWIHGCVSVLGIGGISATLRFRHTDANGNLKVLITTTTNLLSSDRITLSKSVVLGMQAGDKFAIYMTHTRPVLPIVAECGEERSFMTIRRLS